MTLDLYVGFEQDPKGLEAFLARQGYTEIDRKDPESINYTRPDEAWPCLFYSPKVLAHEEGAQPAWEGHGFKVVSELDINYVHDSWEEAERIAQEVTKNFKGIYCDPQQKDYFTADEL